LGIEVVTVALKGKVVSGLLFDLDETLIADEAATVAALEATASFAGSCHTVNIAALAAAVRSSADQLWQEVQTSTYCQSIGISSCEALWCRFEGGGAETRVLRHWAPKYRRQAWSLALAEQDIRNISLAEELAERFCVERRSRQATFEDVAPALDFLKGRFALGLITNGASCLQREKLMDSGLADRFQSVTVSAELGIGKPDVRIFEHALTELGVAAHEAVMIGDNLTRDVAGALASGIKAIWINRHGQTSPDSQVEFLEVDSLAALPTLMLDQDQ